MVKIRAAKKLDWLVNEIKLDMNLHAKWSRIKTWYADSICKYPVIGEIKEVCKGDRIFKKVSSHVSAISLT
jgi:hypothetical protein